MRISLYFFRLADSSGGAERMLLGLAGSLAERGHDVHVVSWDPPGSVAFYEIAAGITWHQLGSGTGIRDKLRRTRALGKVLRSTRSDVLVGFVMSTDKTVYAACLLAGVPFVAAERNSPEMYRRKFSATKTAFYMRLLQLAKAIVIQIEAYRAGYPAYLAERIEVIPNPVRLPTTCAQPDLNPRGGWTLLSVGRFEEQKNHEVLVRAFASIADEFPDWKLRIVGDGSLHRRLADLVAECSLSGRVELPGALAQLEDEYRAAHLFCLASWWEGFPNAVAEAMAAGLPAVGFAGCPGVNALLEHEVDGILVPGNGDVAALADGLRRLMASPALRRELGGNARRIAQRFDAAGIVDAWERVLAKSAGVAVHG